MSDHATPTASLDAPTLPVLIYHVALTYVTLCAPWAPSAPPGSTAAGRPRKSDALAAEYAEAWSRRHWTPAKSSAPSKSCPRKKEADA